MIDTINTFTHSLTKKNFKRIVHKQYTNVFDQTSDQTNLHHLQQMCRFDQRSSDGSGNCEPRRSANDIQIKRQTQVNCHTKVRGHTEIKDHTEVRGHDEVKRHTEVKCYDHT